MPKSLAPLFTVGEPGRAIQAQSPAATMERAPVSHPWNPKWGPK